ncbi:RNA-splicing ligase RtcB [Pseudomonas solani]|uniref:tRNA-splicing ligase RtcB n=1 Tax=Pseudomonas solani TaxID=2731552 RepID=A0ABM7LE68_9PSED|nr:RtcB family protein [Pseudomonas solani]BCD87879.1 RNA-splicing ligase RtcB [Pseudomonas solani]
MKKTLFKRVQQKLARSGVAISRVNGNTLSVSSLNSAGLGASILLPESFPIEEKAVLQLLDFAGVSHPEGGEVRCACATPDFHAGSGIPVGSVIVTSPDMVIPQSIGTDINCGMRLHRLGIHYDAFLARKAEWVERVRGDLLGGTRNIPTAPGDMTALFAGGLGDFWSAVGRRSNRDGILARLDLEQVTRELAGLHPSSFARGEAAYAPEALQNTGRAVLRDPGLGTIGGGNHFVEVQVVTELVDRRACFERGLSVGQVVVMIHTGSRDVGFHVGRRWMDKARELWPKGMKHPESKVFALVGEMAGQYLLAMHSAAHYADANRALIAEMVRQRTRELFGPDTEAPLLVDVPHNIVLQEAVGNVHRKGATPAYAGQDLLIPGSMGHDSYLLTGLGNERWLSSASHGAGRSMSRSEILFKGRKDPGILGLERVQCITTREERLIEEAPGAYKEIGDVVRSQVEEETVAVIARFSPVLTFKA